MRDVQGVYSFSQAEMMVDLAIALVDCTDTIEHCRIIPSLLARSFDIDSITLAIVSIKLNADPQFVMCAQSGHSANELATHEEQQSVRGLFVQIPRLLENDPQVPCEVFYARHVRPRFWQSNIPNFCIPVRVIVFTRGIDAAHRMVLVAYGHVRDGGITPWVANGLSFIAHELSKLLRCAIMSQNSPLALGSPFDSLTRPELKVLLALDSDLSEKELAIRLKLSPHTLHSYIKSIYRKVRVQGRLPLLLQLHSALRRMRTDIHMQQTVKAIGLGGVHL